MSTRSAVSCTGAVPRANIGSPDVGGRERRSVIDAVAHVANGPALCRDSATTAICGSLARSDRARHRRTRTQLADAGALLGVTNQAAHKRFAPVILAIAQRALDETDRKS